MKIMFMYAKRLLYSGREEDFLQFDGSDNVIIRAQTLQDHVGVVKNESAGIVRIGAG
jgi:hypothetical protein